MGRTILGAVAGLLVAFFTIMVVEFAGHQVYPPPPGLDPMVPADMAMIMQSMPLGAMLLVVVAWLTGAFDGGFVAALVARGNRPRVAAVVPALLVMAGVVGMACRAANENAARRRRRVRACGAQVSAASRRACRYFWLQ